MASSTDIARAKILLGDTGRWTDQQISDMIDTEGGVPEACVLLLESAAAAASFDPDVTAGSQSVKSAHVSASLRRAAQAIRDRYNLAGAAGTIGTTQGWTGRDVLGMDCCTCGNLPPCPWCTPCLD